MSVSEARADINNCLDRKVGWGGVILETKNTDKKTSIAILAYPLDSRGWPDQYRQNQGRFLAKFEYFLDPAVYQPGRVISLIGRCSGEEKSPVGEFEYVYPVVEVETQYLFPVRDRYYDYDPDYYYQPHFYFWYPYYYPWYYPYPGGGVLNFHINPRIK